MVTPGPQTTEHSRAWRAEAVCFAVLCVGVWQLFTAHWPFGFFLQALAVVGYVAVAGLYSRHRTQLKINETNRQIAELSTPRQRVV